MDLKAGVLIICYLAIYQLAATQEIYKPEWESIDKRPVAPWFEDAKLGIFIHYGPYSVPAWSEKGTYSEWYQYWVKSEGLFGNGNFKGDEVTKYHHKTYGKDFSYYKFGEMMTARAFNAGEWADLFVKAGARYMVVTSKHHDGFCLWPSKEASQTWGFPWNSMEIGPKRDLLKELEVAVKKTNVRFGTYFSLYEWYNPLYQSDKEKYVLEHAHPQFKDLVERYQPDLIWSDGDWEMKPEKWHSTELLSWLFNESSVKNTVVINDRWGEGARFKHGGYYTSEYGAELKGDKPWEECRGIGFSFGYNSNEDSWDYVSEKNLIFLLLHTVSNGGNLLLGVGPDAHGDFPPIMQERLLALGEWLKVNGEAIYGSRKWVRACQWSEKGLKDWKPEGVHYLPNSYIIKQTIDPEPGYAVREIFFTQKGNDLFAIVPKWPKETLIIRDCKIKDTSAITLLGTDIKIDFEQIGDDLVLNVPCLTPEELPCNHAYTFKISQ
jgi:alpha-L-fucosidase